MAREYGATCRLKAFRVTERWSEVRLKFNSPATVEAFAIAFVAASLQCDEIRGEIELFWWQADDLWELADLSLS